MKEQIDKNNWVKFKIFYDTYPFPFACTLDIRTSVYESTYIQFIQNVCCVVSNFWLNVVRDVYIYLLIFLFIWIWSSDNISNTYKWNKAKAKAIERKRILNNMWQRMKYTWNFAQLQMSISHIKFVFMFLLHVNMNLKVVFFCIRFHH